MLENLLFLLLGGLLGSLLGRASKRYDERKEWYRKVLVELAWIRRELPRADPKKEEWREFWRKLKTVDHLLDSEVRIYGSDKDLARISQFDSEAKALISRPLPTIREVVEQWSALLDGLIDYFLPKVR